MSELLEEVTAILSSSVERWRRLASAVPEELLRRPPATGEWSAAECFDHLLTAEVTVFGERLRACLEGRDMAVFDPNAREPGAARPAVASVVEEIARAREENLAVLGGVGDADLEKTAAHPQHGPISLRVVLNTWAAHDLQHTVQLEEALMQRFLPETGPFRYRFAAHEVTPPAEG